MSLRAAIRQPGGNGRAIAIGAHGNARDGICVHVEHLELARAIA